MAVDQNWKILSELSGDAAISRLQLPAPSAILANRCNLNKHQQNAADSEKTAMKKIHDYITEVISSSRQQVLLIGYNSNRFDLPYLRTSFIRNGLDPYFKGKLRYKDLLHAARALSSTHPDFPRSPAIDAKGEEVSRLSLRLETLCSVLKLLKGRQSHHSRADVLLTISLARVFFENFGLDIRKFENYQAAGLQKRGSVCWESVPQYDLSSAEQTIEQPLLLLDSDHRSALWVKLKKYEEGQGRKSISWYSKANSCLIAGDDKRLPQELARKALKEFKSINLKNFFAKSTCDIEQDIYRIDFDGINALNSAIWLDDFSGLKNLKTRDVKIVYLRYELNSYQWGTGQDQRMEKMLRDYALHRYGGHLQLNKFPVEDESCSQIYHPTFAEQMSEIEEGLKNGNRSDTVLLKALKKFYLQSDIFRLAGKELGKTEKGVAERAA